jgi:hypothetical protein
MKNSIGFNFISLVNSKNWEFLFQFDQFSYRLGDIIDDFFKNFKCEKIINQMVQRLRSLKIKCEPIRHKKLFKNRI